MYLKKLRIGSPLNYLGLKKEVQEYNRISTDEELVEFYHKLLDRAEVENRKLMSEIIYAMIGYSTGLNINPRTLIL